MTVDKSQFRVQGGSALPVFLINEEGDGACALIYGLNSDGEQVAFAIDRTRAMPTIDFEHYSIHEGIHYFYTDAVTLGNTASQDYIIATPFEIAIPGQPAPQQARRPHFHFAVTGTAVTEIYLYEDCERGGEEMQDTFNSNRRSGNEAFTKVYKGTTGEEDIGELIYVHKGGSSSNQARVGTGFNSSEELILEENRLYLLRITSKTAGNLVNVHLMWYEILPCD